MKQAFRMIAAALLLHAGQAAAAPFSYDDIVGAWRVDDLRLASEDGVQALSPNDPQYVGAVVEFGLNRIRWLKGTPTRPIDPAIDNCDQTPAISLGGGGLTIACGGDGWGPSPGAVVRPVAGGRIEISWFDGGILTLSRVR